MKNFERIMDELKQDPQILALRQYPQHDHTNTYCHCLHVAYTAYRVAKALHLKVDEKALARGAMLHDFYQYDIKKRGYTAWRHGTRHARVALRKAQRCYRLTEKERDIIYTHMWPLNITHLPHCRESVLICLVDKYCAFLEEHKWKNCRHISGVSRENCHHTPGVSREKGS